MKMLVTPLLRPKSMKFALQVLLEGEANPYE